MKVVLPGSYQTSFGSIRSKLSQLQVDCNCMENHADGISMLDVITCIATPHRGCET